MAGQRFAFGPFLFDGVRGLLLRHGSPIAVGNRGLALLRALLEADGNVVTKSELMDAAWPDTTIEESNLTVQIAQLRKFLGVSSNGDEWIVTVPRVGYRFLGSRRADNRTEAPEQQATPAPFGSKPSIAVLPFNNISSDPEQEYFAEGLSEDLITDLSKVPGLMVIARNSSFAYKERPLDVRLIARELGVRYVIEGSVRRAATRVRITAQLIDATDNSHLWADPLRP
jgi:TolB-like protein